MSLKELDGNLLECAEQGMFEVIVQGCNCQNVFGAGLAKQIRMKYPQAYLADSNADRIGVNVLGNVSVAQCQGFIIVNAYTQKNIGGGLQTSYEAVRECMKKIRDMYPTLKIGFPKNMCCGLGGGDWGVVSKIIEEELHEMDITFVNYGGK
jgi:O-acetyl-ADP-ribose deacetylase (regulator of RNase III)